MRLFCQDEMVYVGMKLLALLGLMSLVASLGLIVVCLLTSRNKTDAADVPSAN